MNIFEKIQRMKLELLNANLKKTGENKYAGFKYYELADITPTIIKLCNKYGIFSQTTFNNDFATLRLCSYEKPEEEVIYTSPMRELTLKGTNEIQNLGGVETYQRRYLWLMALDIIENDTFDSVSGRTEEDKAKEYKFKSGKHAGKTIREVADEDESYLTWCLDNGKNEEIKRYIELITALRRTPIPSEKDQNIKLTKMMELDKLMNAKGIDRDEFYGLYNVKTNGEMTIEQLTDAIEKLED